MTDQQELFCVEYLKDLNGSKAAIRAGYSENTARFQASTLLTNHNIREYIDKQLSEIMKAGKKTLEKRIIDELETMAFDSMMDEDSQLRYADKIKSLELLGKYTALFVDKVEHIVNDDVIAALKAKYQNK